MYVSRRQFLKRTLGTAAACGLARRSPAADERPESITDTHVYLGHWPHQQLTSEEPKSLVADLRRNGITQAWVGSFDGLFHKDVAGVNQRLAETCAHTAGGSLIPFGTINPTLPHWEDDVCRCHETFHMPGIRLHPNYHGYTLDDPQFARLLELAATRRLIVQLVVWMESERHLLLNPRVTQVDVQPLAKMAAGLPTLRIVVTNGYRKSADEEISSLLPLKSIHFDFARAEMANHVRLLIEKTSPDRVVFGSGMPLHDVEPVITKMEQAELTNDHRQAVAMRNANRLIAFTKTH